VNAAASANPTLLNAANLPPISPATRALFVMVEEIASKMGTDAAVPQSRPFGAIRSVGVTRPSPTIPPR
jgi:hypothetical protein